MDERTQEYVDTMIDQFRSLAPTMIRWDLAEWHRLKEITIDASDLNFPAVGFTYECGRGRNRTFLMRVRLTLDVGADTYVLRVMANGMAVLDVTDIYVDQLADLQGMISRAEAQVRAMAVA